MALQKLTISKKKQFIRHVEQAVCDRGMNYIDAICDYCEKNNVEPHTITSMIPKQMKDKLKVEAQDLNFIKGKTAKLF